MIFQPSQFGVPVNSNLRLFITLTGTPVPFQVDFKGLILQPSGSLVPLTFRCTVTADSSARTFLQPLSEGHLISLVCKPVGTNIKPGQVFCRVAIGQVDSDQYDARIVIFANYITSYNYMGFPFAPLVQPTFDHGYPIAYNVVGPGAGNEWTYTVPPGKSVLLRSISFSFSTSAVVQTRIPKIVITPPDGSNYFICSFSQLANFLYTYSFFHGVGNNVQIGNYITSSLPSNILLPPGSIISSFTDGIDVDDQYDGINIFFEEYQNDQS